MIPRRGSRKITVDGVNFVYLIKFKPSKYIGGASSTATLVIQNDNNQPVRIILQSKISEELLEDENMWSQYKLSLLPNEVRKIIETTINNGWKYNHKSNILNMKLSLELTDYFCV